jgi:Trp operon repressor
MPPVSRRIVSPKITKNIYDLLVRSFSKAHGKNEVLPFVSDLLTPTEQTMISKRLAIAFLLLRKDFDYREIAKTLKVSTATVARVNMVLNTRGAGYRNILGKVIKDESIKLILGEIYDAFTPPRGIDTEAWEARRRIIKRSLKSF